MARLYTLRRKCIHVAMGVGGAVALVQPTKYGYKVVYLETAKNLNGWEKYSENKFTGKEAKRKACAFANRSVTD